jgi:NADH-quinone oxidoreductase subunit F
LKIRYIEAAVREGIRVETMVQPVKIYSQAGRLVGIECIRNQLGEVDASGRRSPVPMPGSEFSLSLNTLIVAIGERPDSDCLASMGIRISKGGRLPVNARTFATNRQGVFAGGDLVTGPNTVADALAAGKKAAAVIDCYLRGESLAPEPTVNLPEFFLEPADVGEDEREQARRAEPPVIPVESRRKNFAEVEMALSTEQAHAEARRCLRCDLAFTRRRKENEPKCVASGETSA